jgi:glycosyltransferase involved in cell wall biosynthesis
VGGTPEALVDGVSGLLVPPADAAHSCRRLRESSTIPALGSRLGSGAQVRIADRFSVDRMVSATENLYFDLMARKQVPAVAPAC